MAIDESTGIKEETAGGKPTGHWRRVLVIGLVIAGLLAATIPAGLLLGNISSGNAQQEAAQLEDDLRQAVVDGVDQSSIQPLQDRLAAIRSLGEGANEQLRELKQLRRDFDSLYARVVSDEREKYGNTYQSWLNASKTAQSVGLSFNELSDQVARIHGTADAARTPAAIRGVAGVLATYITTLSDRLTAFNSAKAVAEAALAEARATLQNAKQYPALKLDIFQAQLDAAAKDLGGVKTPDGFKPIQDRIQQIEAGIEGLLTKRQVAYAELAAARVALDTARSAGLDVTGYASRINSLESRLKTAGDDATFGEIATQLRAVKEALNATLVVTIPAPVYKQAMALDCEVSALRIALAYYGRYYTDAELFSMMPVDRRAPVMGSNRAILQWGNPYTHFVGDVNGAQAIPTGYGVYYPPIVNLATSHGLPNTVGAEGYNAGAIYAELRAQHPVVVWGEYKWNSYQRGVWTAWDGARVPYSYGQHAVTLTGVSSTQVRVNDVGTGTQYWIPKSTFEASWSVFNNMAVTVK